MSHIKGKFCGDFASPKTPFSSSPFYGRYSRSGGGLTGGDEGDSTTTDPFGATPTTPGATDPTTPAPGDDEQAPDAGADAGWRRQRRRRLRPDPVRVGAAAARRRRRAAPSPSGGAQPPG